MFGSRGDVRESDSLEAVLQSSRAWNICAIELTLDPALEPAGATRRRSAPSCVWFVRCSKVERRLEMKGFAGDVGDVDVGGGSSIHPVRDRDAARTSERLTSAMLQPRKGGTNESEGFLGHYVPIQPSLAK